MGSESLRGEILRRNRRISKLQGGSNKIGSRGTEALENLIGEKLAARRGNFEDLVLQEQIFGIANPFFCLKCVIKVLKIKPNLSSSCIGSFFDLLASLFGQSWLESKKLHHQKASRDSQGKQLRVQPSSQQTNQKESGVGVKAVLSISLTSH